MATTMTQSPPFMSPNPTAHNKQHQEVDDHLDTLSLRDLPITTVDSSLSPSPSPSHHQQSNHSRRSSSDPTADFFFEFLVNNDDDLITSAADDVFFHGRLLPFTPPPPQPQPHPRRSLSLSSRFTRRQLTDSSSESSPPSTIRPSKSLNYRKLHRNHHRSNSKPKSEPLHRYSCNNNNNEKLTPAKSPWNWLIFGLPKIPAEMELKDIKNRQYRRNLSASKSSNSSSGENNNNRCSSSSSASWRILSVLSCKSHATVDVHNTTPFRNNFLM